MLRLPVGGQSGRGSVVNVQIGNGVEIAISFLDLISAEIEEGVYIFAGRVSDDFCIKKEAEW
ncbi:hypothetical protein ACFO25_10500 [Paenactinomyces guangxiensis]|uniref:Uncharacterized protein n=1 Tax=Paenactinomyces guangxiensis TaxID=1490290 RepID=A0A7W1WQF3_9BACL|nr:hypothetical protein [Paenactinomyces guangxiensis]MBA4494172.1 hypothetical protein [Paenactinomyces guangxiensis]MBH8591083.1 hypothetical protein [Paenactinomyces guangxiensis]